MQKSSKEDGSEISEGEAEASEDSAGSGSPDSDSESDLEAESDSDVSVVSEENVPSSKVRSLVADAKKVPKKRRR